MHDPVTDPRPVLLRRVAETAIAAGLVVFRLLRSPVEEIWRDWMLVIALYWILCIWGRRGRLWPTLTLVAMALLASVYLHGQLRHTLYSLGLSALPGSP